MSNPDLLNLYCWVLGDGPENVFAVEISSDKDVCTLKKFIKNVQQPIFDHIAASALVLYKITVTDAALDDELERINLENIGNLEKLRPTLKLSWAFPLPLADDELYVVIVRPPGECKCSLRCWY
jgi:Crinkler effector protein N-terminal domain